MFSTPETAPAAKPAKTERKKRKALSAAAIGRRVASIKQMDKDKAKKGRRRLLHGLLSGIADGSIEDPARAAREFLALSPKKPAAED